MTVGQATKKGSATHACEKGLVCSKHTADSLTFRAHGAFKNAVFPFEDCCAQFKPRAHRPLSFCAGISNLPQLTRAGGLCCCSWLQLRGRVSVTRERCSICALLIATLFPAFPGVVRSRPPADGSLECRKYAADLRRQCTRWWHHGWGWIFRCQPLPRSHATPRTVQCTGCRFCSFHIARTGHRLRLEFAVGALGGTIIRATVRRCGHDANWAALTQMQGAIHSLLGACPSASCCLLFGASRELPHLLLRLDLEDLAQLLRPADLAPLRRRGVVVVVVVTAAAAAATALPLAVGRLR